MSVSVRRQMFGSGQASHSRLAFMIVRPALWRSESPREKIPQSRTSSEVVGHLHRLHVCNLNECAGSTKIEIQSE
jgi:hypothetical protein